MSYMPYTTTSSVLHLLKKRGSALNRLNIAENDRGIYTPLRVLGKLLGKFSFEYSSLILVSSFLSGAEGILHPLLIKSIFDEIDEKRGLSKFIILIISYLALGIFINLASTGTAFWGKSFENRVVKTISHRMFESYYNKEYSSILQNGHGYFINRVYGDVREGLIPLLSLIQAAINQSVLLVSLSLILIYLSWRAFIFLAIIVPISAAAGSLLGKKIKTLTSQEREQEGEVLSTLTKALVSFRMVKAFRLSSKLASVFDNRLEKYLVTIYRRYKVTRTFQSLNDLTMVISDFLSMFVGALFVLKGELTFGAYLAFVNSFWRAVTTLMQLFNRIPDFQNLSVVVARIFSFLSTSMTEYHQSGPLLSVKNLEFSYNGRLVMKDFSLQLLFGERVVIVGPNGSGKTTLANILSGYMAPSQGTVFLPQKISSITLPISFPPLKVKDLVQDLFLLAAFSLGYHEVLEAFADELSAGQQQKLAILLALSQEADLYIIDEPLANLDQESRDTAVNLIFEKTRGKNLILIMHGSEEYHKLFDRVIKIDLIPHVNQ
jgi:ABC-type bacteriocin/lantibiotic exporter with double-glycine peptidase domain